MRSRDMMNKLDRLPTRKEEVKVWDLSLLSPADQDRADELMDLIKQAEDLESKEMHKVLVEFNALVGELPMLGENDPDGGPTIEVPHDLRSYWTWIQKASEWRHYSFSNLGKVQTLRFVDLCTEYGFEAGCTTGRVRDQMVPLAEWDAADRVEMSRLLDIAAGIRHRIPIQTGP